MNKLISIFIIFICFNSVVGQDLRFEFGSLAVHVLYNNDSKYILVPNEDLPGRYKSELIRVPFSRTVIRPQFGISYRDKYNSKYYFQAGIFSGKDCLYGDIFGLTYESGRSWKYVNIGIMAGGYFRDKKLWQEHHFDGGSFVPLVGIDLTVKHKINERISVELSSKITPILITQNLAFTVSL